MSVAIGDPRFNPGSLVTSTGVTALEQRGRLFAALYLRRHLNGDWGDVTDAECRANDIFLRNGGRLLSRYRIAFDIELQIITEGDRSTTQMRLADEASSASHPFS
ncbi:hypothetical protein [Paraburkholderia aspalathi]|uniref:hypothetical protein n=1 Tax=Paraburkholderia aspalathi TaxID=1324617 RepID=UPI001FCA0E81|nr:hypothetical protein [Paraburkholderia aspalathi]